MIVNKDKVLYTWQMEKSIKENLIMIILRDLDNLVILQVNGDRIN